MNIVAAGIDKIDKKLGELHTMHSTLEYKDTISVDQLNWGLKTLQHFAFPKPVVGIDTRVLPGETKTYIRECRDQKQLLGRRKNWTTKQLVKEKSVKGYNVGLFYSFRQVWYFIATDGIFHFVTKA